MSPIFPCLSLGTVYCREQKPTQTHSRIKVGGTIVRLHLRESKNSKPSRAGLMPTVSGTSLMACLVPVISLSLTPLSELAFLAFIWPDMATNLEPT